MKEVKDLFDQLVEKSGKEPEELKEMITEEINALSGLISEEGAIYLIANKLNVRLDAEKPKRDVELKKIEEIKNPQESVSFIGKVIRKYDKVTFSSSNGGEGCVQSILVADETGIIRVSFWYDKTEILENIHEEDVVKIVNAYTKENGLVEGRIDVSFGQYSDIEVNPEGVSINVDSSNFSFNEFVEKKISEIEEGDKNVKISGIITDFDIPRFYFGCPECFKKVFQDDGVSKCAIHNEVEAIKIPIINIKIDDGSGIIDVVGFRDRAEKLTGLGSDEIINLTEDLNKYRIFSKRITGSKITIVGNHALNNLTGDNQLVVNLVMNLELKDDGSENNISSNLNSSNSEKENSISENSVKNSSEITSSDEVKGNDDNKEAENLDIEEIVFDDDIL